MKFTGTIVSIIWGPFKCTGIVSDHLQLLESVKIVIPFTVVLYCSRVDFFVHTDDIIVLLSCILFWSPNVQLRLWNILNKSILRANNKLSASKFYNQRCFAVHAKVVHWTQSIQVNCFEYNEFCVCHQVLHVPVKAWIRFWLFFCCDDRGLGLVHAFSRCQKQCWRSIGFAFREQLLAKHCTLYLRRGCTRNNLPRVTWHSWHQQEHCAGASRFHWFHIPWITSSAEYELHGFFVHNI